MKISSLQEVKQELLEQEPKKLVELCISLAKYKKDNKEYLTYLLFQAHNEEAYVEQVKTETDQLFSELQEQKNLYYIKKGLRRILRTLNKYCKYLDDKKNATEVHLYFLKKQLELSIFGSLIMPTTHIIFVLGSCDFKILFISKYVEQLSTLSSTTTTVVIPSGFMPASPALLK